MEIYNPWVTMWSHPQKTIQTVLRIRPNYGIFYLGMFYVIQSLFSIANLNSLGLYFSVKEIFTSVVLSAPILGIIWVFLQGWILFITGRVFSGLASQSDLRACYAWAQIPSIIHLLMWFSLLMIEKKSVFILGGEIHSLFFAKFIFFVLGIWSFVLLVFSVKAVQGFSLIKSLFNVIFSKLLSFVFLFVIIILIRYLIN